MTLITITIAGAVWIAALALVWALCVAAGRGDRRAAREPLAAPAGFPELAQPAAAVIDARRLHRQLSGAATLLDASRLSLEARSSDGSVELAAAPLGHPRGTVTAAARVSGSVRESVELVAHRTADQGRFSDADVALLESVAGVLARNGAFSAPDRTERFHRKRSKASAS
jgi:hypothetical protein